MTNRTTVKRQVSPLPTDEKMKKMLFPMQFNAMNPFKLLRKQLKMNRASVRIKIGTR